MAMSYTCGGAIRHEGRLEVRHGQRECQKGSISIVHDSTTVPSLVIILEIIGGAQIRPGVARR